MAATPIQSLEACQEALRASEARFRNLIERNADGIIVVSPTGTIRFMNPAAESLLNCRSDDCIGMLFGIPIVPGDRTELDVPAPDRSGTVAEMRVTQIEWDGEPAYLAALRDVTDRKLAEAALQDADRRKDEFLAMLAHELRNPLAPIRYGLQLLREIDHDPQANTQIRDMMEHQVDHLVHLVDDLLEVSRITRGKIRLHFEPVSLAEVLKRVVEDVHPLMATQQHVLHLSPPAKSLKLLGDATRLEQIFTNLLNNAAKYTPAGGQIWITAGRDGDDAVVSVRDTGIGIAADILPHVFDMFAQADRSLDRAQGGLGIGLTLVKRLVEMHGGIVRAESAGPNLGTEFIVRVPALPPEPEEAESPAAGVGAPEEGRRVDIPRRILIVDDHPDSAKMLASLIKYWGHEARVVHSGPAAIAAVNESQPEIVLLDIGLPGMDGYEVAERLRQQCNRSQPMLLVAVTGYGQENDLFRSWSAGFDTHLVKPVAPAQLKRLLDDPAGIVHPHRAECRT